MPKVEMDIDTTLPPERVLGALLDFSERRPEIWPGIEPSQYEVYSVGEKEAEIKEGSKMPGATIWAKEHYDWSTPGTVRWTVRESNFCTPGSGVSVDVSAGEGGGSRVHLVWERHPSNAKGRMMIVVMKLFGPKILRSYCTKSLDAYAAATGAA